MMKILLLISESGFDPDGKIESKNFQIFININ